MPSLNVEEFLTVRQVAEALGFSTSWVNQLIKRGEIKAVTIGGINLIHFSELKRFKKEHQQR